MILHWLLLGESFVPILYIWDLKISLEVEKMFPVEEK